MPSPSEWVARVGPFGKLSPRKLVRLEIGRLAPVVRIAHRVSSPLRIPERILFDHELVLILQGRGEFRFGAQVLPITPHTLFFVPPFVPHAIRTDSTAEHVAVHFDFAPGVPAHAAKPSKRGPYEVKLSHELSLPRRAALSPDDGVEADCLEVVKAFSAIDPFAATEASAVLTRILIALMRKPADTPADTDGHARVRTMVDKAITFIRDNVAEKLSAGDLAAESGLSESHFNRVFRAQTGYAPMEYLRRYRVQRAKDLLADVDLAVKEIAGRTGFDDAYHFSKVFRQIAGVTPTAYRDSLLSRR